MGAENSEMGNGIPIPLLILGDWVVDENWVLARHQPLLSTAEGRAHLRALGSMQSRLMTFCGAGRVARCLYWLNRFKDADFDSKSVDENTKRLWVKVEDREGLWFQIVGIGNWNKEDESQLYRMFHPLHSFGINSFTLTRSSVVTRKIDPPVIFEQLDGLAIFTLAEACADTEVGTTRIFRLYQQKPEAVGGIELDRRVDFELRFHNTKIEDDRQYIKLRLADVLARIRTEVSSQVSYAVEPEEAKRILDALQPILDALKSGEQVDLQKINTDAYEANNLLTEAVRRSAGAKLEVAKAFPFAVIKDLGKGTVTSSLLSALAAEGFIDRKTLWFISSKRAQPRWLEGWDPKWGKVHLWFLPSSAIAQLAHREPPEYVKQSGHEIRSVPSDWSVAGKHPSRGAMEVLDRLLGFYFKGQDDVTIVAMPRGLSVLGVQRKRGSKFGYYQPDAVMREAEAELTGRASMFFAALASEIISSHVMADPDPLDSDLESSLELALKAAEAWVAAELNHIRSFGGEGEDELRPRIIGYDPSLAEYREQEKTWHLKAFQWETERSSWEAAHSGTGVIRRGGGLHLDIWRAMCQLDGYVETVGRRENVIADFTRILKEYARKQKADRSLSALLIAKPGSGKSFLVSRLAKILGALPLTFT